MALCVQNTAELRRILSLPKRAWEDLDAVDLLTNHFRTPTGTMRLRPVQASALVEAHDCKGLFLQAGIGKGKTLISALLPTAIPCQRPMLSVPASMMKGGKTVNEFRELSKHWQIRPMRIETHELLGTPTQSRMLDTYQPDLLVIDEADGFANPKSARTRRVERYLREHPECKVVLMSGTMAKRSIDDFWHLLKWCLRDGSPLPDHYPEMRTWSMALGDESDVDGSVLLALGGMCPRTAVRERLWSTPGMMSTTDNEVEGSSLTVIGQLLEVSPEIEAAYATLKQTWMTPYGLQVADGVTMWRHSRELANGFFNRWDPPAPADWLDARQAYHKAVRGTLTNNRRKLDTEKQVRDEIRRIGGNHPLWKLAQEWWTIKPSFVPNPVPVFLDERAIDAACEWAEKNTGVIWSEWPCVGRKIAKRLGIPYYGSYGLDDRGTPIEQADPNKCAVAGIKPNRVGRNLQFWHKALVVSAPPTGRDWEQMLGRLHRSGQKKNVEYTVFFGCREQEQGFMQSMRDAQFHCDLLGSHTKLSDKGKAVSIVIPEGKREGWAWAEPQR